MPAAATASRTLPPIVSDAAPDFVKRVTALMLANKGDLLPVSAFPVDGTWPRPPHSGRNTTSLKIFPSGIRLFASSATNAQWSPACRHSRQGLRVGLPEGGPGTFKSMDYKGNEFKGLS